MMTYKEYVEKYDDCYGHDGYDGGETMVPTLEELLDQLKEHGYYCPETVSGGIPVKITINPKSAVDGIEEALWDHDFAGEDYEISNEGRAFLKKCFEEYNERYANNGYYRETVEVTVPDEMKYEMLADNFCPQGSMSYHIKKVLAASTRVTKKGNINTAKRKI